MILKDNYSLADAYRPNPSSGAGVKLESYESLSEDEQLFIDELAMEVTAMLPDVGVEATKSFIEEKLAGGEPVIWKNALWWMLDSKTRSALKK